MVNEEEGVRTDVFGRYETHIGPGNELPIHAVLRWNL